WGCDNIPCIVSVDEPELSKGELNCYPNPTNGRGVILGSLTKFTGHTEIKVFNTLGQLVQTIPITQKDFEVEVNLTQKGLYLVNLYQNNELIESKKWVVN
ncbi:MAG: T9SS type A sorting domain-containing protein, partial [Salibacteraceae bacterium]